jgi:hypothetical protein
MRILRYHYVSLALTQARTLRSRPNLKTESWPPRRLGIDDAAMTDFVQLSNY